ITRSPLTRAFCILFWYKTICKRNFGVRDLRTGFFLLLLLCLGWHTGAAAAAGKAISGGPKQLLIAYRAQPADRPAFRDYLKHHEAQLLGRLEREGVLSGYQI